MIQQYECNGARATRVPVGSIVRIAAHDPEIVEGHLNREYHMKTGRSWQVVYLLGGHLAVTRSLRTGKRRRVSAELLRRALEIE